MKTNIIPTKVHGYIDYVTAASLLAMPMLISGKNKGVETFLPLAMGAGVLIQSLMTGYEKGSKKKKMKMDSHLKMDYVTGALLAAAPILFGFQKKNWMPYLAIGLSELAVAYFTKPKPKKRLWGIFG